MDISAYTHTRNSSSVGFLAKDNINASNSSSIEERNLIIDQSQDAYSQVSQVFRQIGHEVAETPLREDAISGDIDKVKAQYRSMMMASKLSADRYTNIAEPVEDGRSHIAGLHSMIGNIHSGYQKKYGEIVKASTQYMQDINTAIGKLSDHVKAGGDGKIHIKLHNYAGGSLNSVLTKYSYHYDSNHDLESNNPGQYYSNWSPDNDLTKPIMVMDYDVKEYQFWEKKLGGQGFIVREKNGKIEICPDLQPVREIFKSLAASSAKWGGSDIMVQELQSLQTAIDAQKNAVNNSVSRLLETFRQDNSHFETLVQLLIQLIKDLNQNNNSLINM